MEQEQMKFAHNASKLIQYINDSGYHCTFGEAYRTPEQAAIDARKCIGIKNSLHCHRLAIDINLFDKDGHYLPETKSYEKFGVFWESLHEGNRWGGRFQHRADGNHFECHTIHTPEQILVPKLYYDYKLPVVCGILFLVFIGIMLTIATFNRD